MVWNIDLDDFQQSCSLSTRPYPLMSLMSEILKSPAGEPTYNTSSGSTENKPSGSLSSESEEEWSSSNGAANSENDQQGNIWQHFVDVRFVFIILEMLPGSTKRLFAIASNINVVSLIIIYLFIYC